MAGNARDKRIQAWVLFVAGVAFLGRFAFYDPDRINKWLTLLIGSCLFGPKVINSWRGKDDEDDD